MTSEPVTPAGVAGPVEKAYVWTWLPGATDPVVAGLLEARGRGGAEPALTFAYAQSYVARGAPALYLPELPVVRGRQEPAVGLDVHGVIRDAGPDSWGQRVILRRLGARDIRDRDTGELPLLTYLLESGSNRTGALDFQSSPTEYVARTHTAELDDMLQAADALESGAPIDDDLREALDAGSSIGGARPKAHLVDGDRQLIAKFSAPTDPYPVMKAEAVAMDLARRVGLTVAATELIEVNGRDVLLVDRFDRGPGGRRHQLVSALTILGLSEMNGRYATYHELADVIRGRFTRRAETLRELFGRIVFNVLVGNTDDHARNHAAFWNGDRLTLTPAYDICPQARAGGEAAQAMEIGPGAGRMAQVGTCIAAAATYELDETEARAIVDRQQQVIHDQWSDAADVARLTTSERDALWGRQVLNPFATYGHPPTT